MYPSDNGRKIEQRCIVCCMYEVVQSIVPIPTQHVAILQQNARLMRSTGTGVSRLDISSEEEGGDVELEWC